MKIRLAAILLAVNLTACAVIPRPDPVQHVVLVWLKPEFANAEYRQQLITETRRLQEIPGIVSLKLGMAIASDRPVVDDSFDLGVVMTFADEASMRRYVEDPRHQAFLAEFIRGRASALKIYDFIDN